MRNEADNDAIPKRSRSDRLQAGNPHQLVLRQHVFPRASIARFTDAHAGVELVDIGRSRVRKAKPDDALFCADRAWSNGAEVGWMKRIEDGFQALAQLIVLNPFAALEPRDEVTVREFYTLWHARAERRSLSRQYVTPKGALASATAITQDEIELLEKNGIIAVRPDGSFAFRDLNTAHISLRMRRLGETLVKEPWGVIIVPDGEFCVPNTPTHGIIPINPSIALMRNSPSGRITRANLIEINRAMLRHATEYIFAKSLAACPGIGDPNNLRSDFLSRNS